MIAMFNRFEIVMTLEQARSASHQGQCDEDVSELLKHPKIQRQLKQIGTGDVVLELKEYGAWDQEELRDHPQNQARIIWLAAGNIVEEQNVKTRS